MLQLVRKYSLLLMCKVRSCEWSDRTFEDLWTSISWSHSLKLKFSNLLTLADIAKCQCVSIATCERVFLGKITSSIRRNRMTTTHLDSVMRVAIERPTKNFEFILQEAISLWMDSKKLQFLFTNPEKYFAGRVEVESEDGGDFHP